MQRLVALAIVLATGAVGFAQETLVRQHPTGTWGGQSVFRYDYEPCVCPPGTADAVIPLAETKRLLCELTESPVMSKKVGEWVDLAVAANYPLNKEDVFVSYLELCRESNGPPHFGHYLGNEMVYASSVAKLFYATSAYYRAQEKKQKPSTQLVDDIKAMLHNDDHAATNRVVDFVTGTRSGDSLSGAAYREFAKKRSYANWLFGCIGFENFNVNQKMWTGAPSPRDLQLLGKPMELNYENSNRVTANQAAALMYLVENEAVVSHCASQAMKSYMFKPVEQAKIGTLQGIAAGLPAGSKMIGIKGFTRQNFNEVAAVSLPNGKKYVLSVLTRYDERPNMFVTQLSRIVAHRNMTKTGDDDLSDYQEIPALSGAK